VTVVLTFSITILGATFLLQGNKVVIMPSKDEKAFTKMLQLRSELRKKCIYKQSDAKFYDGMYKGMVDSLKDPYTVYMSKSEVKAFMENVNQSYAGIGVVMSPDTKDNDLVVLTTFKGAPSYKAGIKVGDQIIEINGKAITSKDIDKAVSLMKGKVGRHVTVKLYRPSTKQTLTKNLVTEQISIPTIESSIKNKNIGYIKVTQFAENTDADFINALNSMRNKNIKGLIIDLRDNPGGYVDDAINISNELLPKDTIFYTVDNAGKKEVSVSDDKHKLNIPIVVLVNGQSASASEIVSGALKDNKHAVLIGTKTYGKGVVQGTFDLKDGSAIKITVARYYTPSGVCIQGKGIKPDIKVELPNHKQSPLELTNKEKDTQLEKALEYIGAK
jgi:carboxyl-terminal processing protease